MNELFNNKNINKFNINKSQSKERNKNYFAVLSNFSNNQNRYLSEKQRNLTKFNSQKKIRKKESYSKNKNPNDNKSNGFIISFNDNNIKLKNYSNLVCKTSKIIKNTKSKNKSQCLSKPQLEMEVNHRNNSNNVSKNYVKTSNRKYKKNISEYDLNNILNTFTNANFSKGVNVKLNFTSKKKIENDNNLLYPPENKKNKQNKMRHSSDTKLIRSSSGYSYINSNLAQTNSFFNVNHSNQLGYISTWGNNPDWTNSNFENIIKLSEQKKSHDNKQKIKSNKGPIIGKIIKNYKNNDLNCIFNMNVIPPVSQINNIQEYFKNMYKIEYNSDNRKNKNRKNKKSNDKKDEKTKITTDDFTQSKNTLSKASDVSKTRKEKDSIDILKNCNDSPEEIHFYVISSIQVSKNLEKNLIKK